jgi:hypothetical protein
MTRRALTAALLGAAVLATPAHAARRPPPRPPKPSCKVVTDAQGDAKGLAGPATNTEGDTGLDLVSADLASNATKATVVWRLPGLNNNDPLSPAGRWFGLTYSVGGRTTTMSALLTPRGNTYGKDAANIGVVDTKTAEIRVTVSLAEAGLAGAAPGATVSGFSVVTKRWVGAGSTGQVVDQAVDTATGTLSYKVGAPSCVKVGADVAST